MHGDGDLPSERKEKYWVKYWVQYWV